MHGVCRDWCTAATPSLFILTSLVFFLLCLICRAILDHEVCLHKLDSLSCQRMQRPQVCEA